MPGPAGRRLAPIPIRPGRMLRGRCSASSWSIDAPDRSGGGGLVLAEERAIIAGEAEAPDDRAIDAKDQGHAEGEFDPFEMMGQAGDRPAHDPGDEPRDHE